jgi:predicted ribosomally synthesized peptide with nif11-like leader
MPLEDARKFVARMQEDTAFRRKVAQMEGPEELSSCLCGEGMLFNQQELIGAMAECMAQMEEQMRG